MKEVKLYGVILMTLMLGAYLSWTDKDDRSTETKATIMDAKVDQLDRVTLFAKTQTVAVGFEDLAGDRYVRFTVDARKRKRAFVGNPKAKDLLEGFAPFEALRSLGSSLSAKELEATKLEKPERKLEVVVGGKTKTFDVGGRTTGARDHYVRAQGGSEVFLVASKVLGDLEFPEGKFMQRQLRTAEKKEVGKLVLVANGKTLTAIQKNRLSPKDAFWTRESSEEKDEAVANFADKLDKLTAIEYADDADTKFAAGTPVFEATWFDEDGKNIGQMKMARDGEGKKADYYASSTATRVAVKVSRFTAEQLETSLSGLFE